ncbi:ShlB/FhaC/HecB family hemolysin secretion/activation protein [Alcaligenes endophyticus]|uniref:BamA/TamA family outer membrane protein n=1 Tax=Alcaligenes endophyticus TaxID=1929088 RepID=A0ABT8EIE2_9BURK|nr:ShlB/FhaC/HecB family hemolysin secretion/activation protein [Alcaligenes endophyticus]MCX5592590.1 BamA/TamA family outer membrane protein [Alcaligenes endophyticus]MDN4121062.1 BamA/TamA family outer membrane protein [Alcaligenes endophyticus]
MQPFNCIKHYFLPPASLGSILEPRAVVASVLLTLSAWSAPAQAQQTVTINEYIVRGNTVLDQRLIEQAVYPHLGEGRTLDNIEQARDALQQAYQEAGYQSVYVDLPEQQVEHGIVILQVTEAKVGRLRVEGAQYNSPLAIRDAVPALAEGQVPDFEQAQSQLADLNRGSRQVMPLVREGALPGTLDVDLRVEDKMPWNGSVAFNNDYSADTTKTRAIVSLGHDNLWQLGHSASLTYFTAPERKGDASVISGSYTLPTSKHWDLQLSGYNSNSDIATIGGTNVLGKGHSYGARFTYSPDFQAPWFHSFSAGLDYKRFREELRFGGDSDQVPLTYIPLNLGYNGYRYSEGSQSSVAVDIVASPRSMFGIGSDDEEFDYKRYRADPSFALLKLNLSHTQSLPRDWQMYARLGGQLASGPLVSNEQFSAGGTGTVRGYLAAERSGDEGYNSSIELRTPSLSKWLGSNVNEWRFYAFADAARVRLLDPLPEQEHDFSLASIGLGTRMQVLNWLSANFDWAYPLKDGAYTERHKPRLHFSVRASF